MRLWQSGMGQSRVNPILGSMSALPPESLKYICVWRQVLGGWLGWDDCRVQKFIDRWWQDMAAPDSVTDYYHDFPIECVASVLVPRNLCNRKDIHPIEVAKAIEQAVFNGPCEAHCWASYDWNAARQRVESALATYGASLPNTADLAWYEEDERVDSDA